LSGIDDDSWAALSIYSNALDSSKARSGSSNIESYIFYLDRFFPVIILNLSTGIIPIFERSKGLSFSLLITSTMVEFSSLVA
jgi:hypothetical protein